MFLGCTANSGANAPIVENVEWRKFSISNSIFLDYGLRTYFGKMGLGAPLSWINIANAAATTPESPRREVIVRDTFLDEGGWVGISANPRALGSSHCADRFDLHFRPENECVKFGYFRSLPSRRA